MMDPDNSYVRGSFINPKLLERVWRALLELAVLGSLLWDLQDAYILMKIL